MEYNKYISDKRGRENEYFWRKSTYRKKDDSKLKAVASVTFDDCFVVHDIKVIEGNEGYFIAMPSRKTGEGEYKDIAHPIKTEMREELIKVILSAFEEEKAKPQQD